MKRYLWRFETFAVAAIGVFSGLFLLQTYQYGRRAALFPRIISLTVLFLTGVFVVSRVRRISKQKTASSKEETVRPPSGTKPATAEGVNWLLTLAAATGFLVFVNLIGFGAATFFYVAVHLYLAGYYRHPVIWAFAAAMAITIVGTAYLFAIPLPQGLLIEMISGR